jgi:predicted transcriptional regulator
MHGKVKVGSDHDSERGREQLINAHERAEVVSKHARVTAVGRGDESSEWALLRPAALWQDRVSATLVALGEPAGAEVVLNDQPIGIAPLATLLPAGKHRLQVRVQGRSVLDRELISEAGQTAVIRYDATTAVTEAAVAPKGAETKIPSVRQRRAAARTAPTPAAEPEVSAADMLREAHRLMRAQSFEAAAKQYDALRISYPESPEANTVLVSLAELQLDRLRRPALALDNLDRYLANGSGGLGEEARQVRIRALRALGEREREADAIEEFLGMHPRSFRASALQRRLAELQAER